MGKKGNKKKKKVTPTDGQILEEVKLIKQKHPEYGIKKVLIKVKASKSKWLLGFNRLSNVMRQHNLVNHQQEKSKFGFRLVKVSKNKMEKVNPDSINNQDYKMKNVEEEEDGEDEEPTTTPQKKDNSFSMTSLAGMPSLSSPSSLSNKDDEDDSYEERTAVINGEAFRIECAEILSDDDDDSESVSVPESLRCSLTGRLLVTPVVSIYGNRFEKSMIELWIKQEGQVSPVTFEVLRLQDLKPDTDAEQELFEWKMKQAETSTIEDMYAF